MSSPIDVDNETSAEIGTNPSHSSKQFVPSGSGSTEVLAEHFIRAIDDPAKLQNLLINSYRECLSLEKEKNQRLASSAPPPPPPDNFQRIQEAAESLNEAFKEDLHRQVIEALDQDLKCSICTELYIEPSVLHCGHTFCNYCITEWIYGRGTNPCHCPQCRKSIVLWPVSKNVGIGNLITKLYSLLPGEMQAERDQILRERQDLVINAEAIRAVNPTPNPFADINPVDLRYISANRQSALTMGAALIVVAENITGGDAAGSISLDASLQNSGVLSTGGAVVPEIISSATRAMRVVAMSADSAGPPLPRVHVMRLGVPHASPGSATEERNRQRLRMLQLSLRAVRDSRSTHLTSRPSAEESEQDRLIGNQLRRQLATDMSRLRTLERRRNAIPTLGSTPAPTLEGESGLDNAATSRQDQSSSGSNLPAIAPVVAIDRPAVDQGRTPSVRFVDLSEENPRTNEVGIVRRYNVEEEW